MVRQAAQLFDFDIRNFIVIDMTIATFSPPSILEIDSTIHQLARIEPPGVLFMVLFHPCVPWIYDTEDCSVYFSLLSLGGAST